MAGPSDARIWDTWAPKNWGEGSSSRPGGSSMGDRRDAPSGSSARLPSPPRDTTRVDRGSRRESPPHHSRRDSREDDRYGDRSRLSYVTRSEFPRRDSPEPGQILSDSRRATPDRGETTTIRPSSPPRRPGGLPPRPSSPDRWDPRGRPPAGPRGPTYRDPRDPRDRPMSPLPSSTSRGPSSPRDRDRDDGITHIQDRDRSSFDKGKGREGEGGKGVSEALDTFVRTMHAALLSTSSHALATQALTRLLSFPGADNFHPALVEARRNVAAADRQRHSYIVELQDAFAELMRRAASSRDGDSVVDLGGLELEGVRDRLKRLEGLSLGPKEVTHAVGTAPAPPPGVPPPPPEADIEMRVQPGPSETAPPGEGEAAPKKRVKEVLREILKRLDALEEAKIAAEDRAEDLENLIWEQAEERIERVMTWGQLEKQRIGSRKRKREGDQDGPLIDGVVAEAEPGANGVIASDDASNDVDALAAGSKEVDEGVEGNLRSRVQKLEKELADLKAGRQRENQTLMENTVTSLRSEYTSFLQQEFARIAASFKTRHAAEGLQQQPNGRSPQQGSSSPLVPANGSEFPKTVNQPTPPTAQRHPSHLSPQLANQPLGMAQPTMPIYRNLGSPYGAVANTNAANSQPGQNPQNLHNNLAAPMPSWFTDQNGLTYINAGGRYVPFDPNTARPASQRPGSLSSPQQTMASPLTTTPMTRPNTTSPYMGSNNLPQPQPGFIPIPQAPQAPPPAPQQQQQQPPAQSQSFQPAQVTPPVMNEATARVMGEVQRVLHENPHIKLNTSLMTPEQVKQFVDLVVRKIHNGGLDGQGLMECLNLVSLPPTIQLQPPPHQGHPL